MSGNPAGRPPKALSVTNAVKTMMEAEAVEICVITTAGRKKRKEVIQGDPSLAHSVAIAMLKRALSGDVAAAQFLADRSDGKPLSTIAIDLALEQRLREMSAPETLLCEPGEFLRLPDDEIVRSVFSTSRALVDAPPPTGGIIYHDALTGKPTGRTDEIQYVIGPQSIPEGAVVPIVALSV